MCISWTRKGLTVVPYFVKIRLFGETETPLGSGKEASLKVMQGKRSKLVC